MKIVDTDDDDGHWLKAATPPPPSSSSFSHSYNQLIYSSFNYSLIQMAQEKIQE